MNPLLAELQERWQARDPGGFDEAEWWPQRELNWVRGSPLSQQRAELPMLYRHGEARMGVVLPAFTTAWSGVAVSPGTVLLSWDRLLELRPDLLLDTVHRFHELKSRGSPAAGLRSLVEDCRSGNRSRMRERMPNLLTAGRVVWAHDCLLFPTVLPGGRLVQGALPVVVRRYGPPQIAVPPARFWPEKLRQGWEGA